jgi:hypothetical protein
MQLLPDPEEQEWLIGALAGLVAQRGEESLVARPLVQPTSKFFPDSWSFSEEGLDRVVRRLMQFAGLGHLGIVIEVFTDEQWEERTADSPRGNAAALFFGIKAGSCWFGFNADSPADEEYMAGVMAHEVAHAYRLHHQIPEAETREEEELLTDVTAVYLGFGILAANNSHRYRSAGWNDGWTSYQSWSTNQAGYLTPQAFAFLLALQVQARGVQEKRLVTDHLEANQAACLKAALAAIEKWKEELPEKLGLTGAAPAPGEHRLEEILRPLPKVAKPRQYEADSRFNRGDIVFRLKRRHPVRAAFLGGFAGLLAGFLVFLALEADGWKPGPIVALSLLAGIAGMMLLERRNRREVCSDNECEADLPPDAETCPGCAGRIVGVINSSADRLDARERYEAAQKKDESGAMKPGQRKSGKVSRRPPKRH